MAKVVSVVIDIGRKEPLTLTLDEATELYKELSKFLYSPVYMDNIKEAWKIRMKEFPTKDAIAYGKGWSGEILTEYGCK